MEAKKYPIWALQWHPEKNILYESHTGTPARLRCQLFHIAHKQQHSTARHRVHSTIQYSTEYTVQYSTEQSKAHSTSTQQSRARHSMRSSCSHSEWTPEEVINHSPDAIAVAQFVANFIVGQARQSSAAFPTVAAETAALIYNYAPTYTGLFDISFEQSYFWTLGGV